MQAAETSLLKVKTSFLNTQQYIRYPASYVHIAYTTDLDLSYTICSGSPPMTRAKRTLETK